MARVAVTFRIMPVDVEADLDEIKEGLEAAFGSDLREVVQVPVAFGLSALETIVLLDDVGGQMEESERCIKILKGVSSVETLSVDLL